MSIERFRLLIIFTNSLCLTQKIVEYDEIILKSLPAS